MSSEKPLSLLRSWLLEPPASGHIHTSISVACPIEGPIDSSFPSGNHLRNGSSTEAISPDSILVTVPYEKVLCLPSLILNSASEWSADLIDQFEGREQVLFRWLLAKAYKDYMESEPNRQGESANGKYSQWCDGYLKSLPPCNTQPEKGEAELDLPLYWDDQEMLSLKGTGLYHARWEREGALKEEWEWATKLIGEEMKGNVSWPVPRANTFRELYKWATAIIMSRSFPQRVISNWNFESHGESEYSKSRLASRWHSLEIPVLLPFIDMANHSNTARVTWNSDERGISLITHSGVQAGEEAFNNYGLRGNEEFLWTYGFCLDNNRYDSVRLSLSAANSADDLVAGKSKDERLCVFRMPQQEDDTGNPSSLLKRSINKEIVLEAALQVANSRIRPQLKESTANKLIFPSSPSHVQTSLADKIILALENNHERLSRSVDESLGQTINSNRKRLADVYRQGQINVLLANKDFLEDFLISLQSRGHILTLNRLLGDGSPLIVKEALIELIMAFGATAKAKSLRKLNLHEMIFTVWICLVWITSQEDNENSEKDANLIKWVDSMESAYGSPMDASLAASRKAPDTDPKAVTPETELFQLANQYAENIAKATQTSSNSLFHDAKWTRDLLAWGLLVWEQERIVLESMERIVVNGDSSEHEDMLFLEFS